jgi:predicted alpha/beta superfamily hydrolase
MTDSQSSLTYFPEVETHLIPSRYVDQTFKIQVMRPPQKRDENLGYPVVYVTDGNITFDALKGISWYLQLSERAAPRFILVAIGYPGEAPLTGELLRGRDFTFAGFPDFSNLEPSFEGSPPSAGFYGAEQFQMFIRHELIPFVDGTYDTLPGDRTYYGHSFGGAFGLFTLFTAADLFRHYICSSPTIAYSGVDSTGLRHENNEFMLRRVEDFIKSGNSFDDVQLYLSVGSEEQFDPARTNWQFVSGYYRLVTLLKQSPIPGLITMSEVLVGETHMTSWPIAFIHGVQSVFGMRRVFVVS